MGMTAEHVRGDEEESAAMLTGDSAYPLTLPPSRPRM